MKRVCTLRKVLSSVSKVLLEKLLFIVAFIATQFLSSLEYLQPGDFSCCKYKYNFRNLQVFEHFFSKKG